MPKSPVCATRSLRPGVALRAITRVAVIKGYGRWLSFLHSRGWLDPHEAPLARVTRPRLRAYFRTLLRAGNANSTVIVRFSQLTMALQVIAPGEDVSWICRPDGVSVYALLPKARRVLVVPDGQVLADWGFAMMEEATARPEAARETNDLAAYRDGLLIALFSLCGRRLRSMTLLRPGHELRWTGVCFRIELTAA